MIRFPLPFNRTIYASLTGLLECVGRFALESPYEWPARWRRIYAPIYPLGFAVRMIARVLIWTCFLIPWGIAAGARDHAARLRCGNKRDPNLDAY